MDGQREHGETKTVKACKLSVKDSVIDDKKSFESDSQPSGGQDRAERQEVKGDRNRKKSLRDKHLPERLAVHVLLCDSTVGERLIPNRVQCVANSLRFQFISLCIKAERRRTII